MLMGISWKYWLLIIGVSTLTIRTLLDTEFGKGTLLYIAIPFAISLALAFFTKVNEGTTVWKQYLNHMRGVTIIFLATSVILFEGFICMLMFMPIYYLIASLTFLFRWLSRDKSDDSLDNIFKVSAFPVLILLLVSEGMIPATAVERTSSATFVAETSQSIAELQANMAAPITFSSDRHWFLQLFPLPDSVQAGSLAEGDVHYMNFTYKRWIWTNIHEGQMDVTISKVTPEHIQTKITRNDSYLSNYMEIDGTDVRFTPRADGGTRVALTVRYERLLDPAWYFGPMQNLAAKQSAKQFLRDIIFRHPVEEVQLGT